MQICIPPGMTLIGTQHAFFKIFFFFQRVEKEESWIRISRAKCDQMLLLTKSVSNSSIMTPLTLQSKQ